MQCVILAGGLGTRLGELTRSTPKPMLNVGGRPFIRLLVENSIRFGIDDIVILAGYRADVIHNYFQGITLDALIRVVEEEKPLGTAGAIRFAAPVLKSQFLLMNGDSWFDLNLLDLAAGNWPCAAIVRMALRQVEDVSRFGSVCLASSSLVTKFGEKSQERKPGLINGGVYYIKRDELLPYIPENCQVSLEQEVFSYIAKENRLYARTYNGFFIDIGVPEQFNLAQAVFPIKRGAVFFDRDGVLNHDYGYVYRPQEFQWVEGAIETVRAVNDEGRYAFVVTNQAGIARGLYTEDDVRRLHFWMNEELARTGAHIDAFAYCPHHPDGILPKFAHGCNRRKPGPGMILDIMLKWTVDPSRSVLVGDKESDLAAATAAGIRGVKFNGGRLNEVREIFDC
jgi:D,D-heptose 1,7-bisphosphate phosphatase